MTECEWEVGVGRRRRAVSASSRLVRNVFGGVACGSFFGYLDFKIQMAVFKWLMEFLGSRAPAPFCYYFRDLLMKVAVPGSPEFCPT